MAPRDHARAALTELTRLRHEFGAAPAARKRALLPILDRIRFKTARDVLAVHELLCFMRAYPDDQAILARVERMLAGFERRTDLRRFRAALADSGVAGTAIQYRFFAETTKWLARRWPKQLRIDWDELDESSLLEALIPLLGAYAETPGMEEFDYGLRGWLDLMRGKDET